MNWEQRERFSAIRLQVQEARGVENYSLCKAIEFLLEMIGHLDNEIEDLKYDADRLDNEVEDLKYNADRE